MATDGSSFQDSAFGLWVVNSALQGFHIIDPTSFEARFAPGTGLFPHPEVCPSLAQMLQ